MKVWIDLEELWPFYTMDSNEEQKPWHDTDMVPIEELGLTEEQYEEYLEATDKFFKWQIRLADMYEKIGKRDDD